MNAEAFFDTNILIYMISAEPKKALRSEELVTTGGVVSVQVLNEFANVARRKRDAPWNDILIYLALVQQRCRVVPLTLETHDFGVTLARNHGFAIYDAMIIAAAQLAGCATLYSEDMQTGRMIDGMRIVNPYR